MKYLYASRNPGGIERVRCMLEDAGIHCIVRNETTAGLAGEVPFTECMPEVWVADDGQLEEAKRILSGVEQESSANGPSWTCQGCGEVLESQFDSCWRCGTMRS